MFSYPEETKPLSRRSLPFFYAKTPFGKRVFDLFFASFALLFFSPFFLCISFFILATSKGSIFYKQVRIKKGGKPFVCYKFRTMRQNSDALLRQILHSDPRKREEWKKFFKLKKDPRITPIGKFLRKTSLDELPQFWNVLKGDLSIVGPRPVLKQEVEEYYKDLAPKILSVKPGITGLWQVSGRSQLNMEERVRLEASYVDRQSFWLDLFLIAKTIPAMLFPKGAC